ncbi:hypothetical protein PV04_04408 [Phialophora macrospora]|uniref:Transcription factor domain-containing protein n=1 Tax=Phialophora macrospora TaxID=1851006 RepID=A0A0D2CTH3_9EURO|nr:hypothetical protein PV04_04408 [Phialophora macrospora]
MADNHAGDSVHGAAGKKKPLVVSGFEFVLMGSDGALNKKGISQIRAHTTRELHKTRRENGQALTRRRRNRPGNIFYGSQIDPFRTLPQLPIEDQHPGILDKVKHNVFIVFNQKTMQQTIWPQGAKDGTFFTAMLLMCSVHLDGLTTGSASAMTTALKVEAMRLVRQSIQDASRAAIISSISAIACLATSALVRGGQEGAEEYMMHRSAYAVLIKEAIKLNMFEDSRFCKDVLRVITVIAIARRCRLPTAGLAPPADSRTLLSEYEHVFEDRWRSRTAPEPELFSPLYDGRQDSSEDPFPFMDRDHLRLLLQMMQSVIKIWIRVKASPAAQQAPANNLILKSLYQRIFNMPSSKVPDLPSSNDHVYEACRLTSVLLIRAVEHNQHWRSEAAGTSLLQRIRDALQKTDLDGLWGKNIGQLYYVVLVFHSAAFGTHEYLFGHVVQGRIHFELTYSYNDWHGALLPMAVLNSLAPDTKSSPSTGPDALETTRYSTVLSDMQTPVGSSFPIPLQSIESHG